MSEPHSILESMPFSADAEKGVLSCLFYSPTALAPEAVNLSDSLFYHPAHQLLFGVIKDFMLEGRPVEYILISQHMEDTKLMSKIGGQGFLAELLDFVPTPAHWGYYVRILKDKLYLRSIIGKCAELKAGCFNPPEDKEGKLMDPRALLLAAIGELSDLAADGGGKGKQWIHVQDVVPGCIDRLEAMLKNKGHVPADAVATGFTDLDRRTMGLRGGELFIIGARPAMGKSALATNIAECIVMANGHYSEFNQVPLGVGLVTLEMSRGDIADRILVGRSGVDFGKMHTGMFSRRDFENYKQAAADLKKAPLWFLDTGKLSIQELLAMCRHKVESLGLKVLIVDYLQRLCSESKKAQQNRNTEVSEVSTGLKQIAKDFNIVVIALAQVGRSAEDRAGCKPSLADLRESGDIEADADFVGLLYRPGYYARRKAKGKADEDEEEDEILDDKAELIMAKVRRGAPEPVELKWDGPLTKFSSVHDRLFSNNSERRE